MELQQIGICSETELPEIILYKGKKKTPPKGGVSLNHSESFRIRTDHVPKIIHVSPLNMLLPRE